MMYYGCIAGCVPQHKSMHVSLCMLALAFGRGLDCIGHRIKFCFWIQEMQYALYLNWGGAQLTFINQLKCFVPEGP